MAVDVYIREFVHPEDVRIVEEEIAKAFEPSDNNYSGYLEHRIIRRDGEVRTVAVRSSVIRDAAKKMVKYYGANQDITERKGMEEALRDSKEILSLATELAHVGPWEYDVARKLIKFGDEFYAIYGTSVEREGSVMTPDEYVKEFVHPDDARILRTAIVKAIKSKERHYFDYYEYRIIRRDGEVRTIAVRVSVLKDAAGKIIKYYGADQDITERVQAEQELRKLSRAVQQSSAMVVITDAN